MTNRLQNRRLFYTLVNPDVEPGPGLAGVFFLRLHFPVCVYI